jgi:ABC transporter substrate binding protein
MADPVGDEFVASLARPGSNVTGTTFLGPELVAKRLQLLRDVVPGLARVAALWHPHTYGEHTMASVYFIWWSLEVLDRLTPDNGVPAAVVDRAF